MLTSILGAGASRHAGYPVTNELGRFLRDWAIKNESPWSGFIQEAFDLYGGLENLETVLTDLHERPERSPAAKLSRGCFSKVTRKLCPAACGDQVVKGAFTARNPLLP
jgi:hypothetical protein